MNVSRKLTAFAIGSVGLGAMSLMPVAPALAVCDPASTDPSCPIGQLSLSNPANPASPLNMNNPANPASPLSLSNPANPASPLNPNNPASAQYQWAHSPNNPAGLQYNLPMSASPYYGHPTVFDLFGPATAGGPNEADRTEPEAPAPRRHHRHHRRHAYSR